jgi:hypothetical protein
MQRTPVYLDAECADFIERHSTEQGQPGPTKASLIRRCIKEAIPVVDDLGPEVLPPDQPGTSKEE